MGLETQGSGASGDIGKKGKHFFFEKKKQKTFGSWLWPTRRVEWWCRMPLHLIKLSVGTQSLDDLKSWQARHGAVQPPLRHSTRNFPRRAAEILDGGSIYWVINRVVTARQRIVDILEGERPDGRPCTDLILDPLLVPVQGRLLKPFQGWRYLDAKDAPADLARAPDISADLPESLRRELVALCLL